MSLSQDLSVVYDDDFEGSGTEILISQEVFYGIDSASGGQRRELNGFINFGCQQHKFVGSSPSSNAGVVASVASSKDPCLKDGNILHGGSPITSASSSFTEGFMLSESNDHAIPAKRMKLAVNELSSFKPLLQKALTSEVPLKAVVSGVHNPNSCLDCQIVMCHVVESSGEGVKSSCYLLKQGVETERKGCLGDRVPSKDCTLTSEGSEGKQIVVSNTMASPVSQESCLAVASVDETGSRQRAVRKRKIGTPVELDDDEIPWTGDCTKDVRPIVRKKMFQLLASAGWTIEKRRRQCRNYDEFVFISPVERPVRELSKAWILCGQMLLSHGYKQMQVEDGRQWANLEEFCSDLYSIITNMGNELQHWEPKAALAHQWILLDPFVTLIFVDRKVLALKAGNAVKVRHNATNASGKSMVLCKGKKTGDNYTKAKLCDSSLASESTVIDFGRQSQGGQLEAAMSRSIYVSEGDCMRLLETNNKNGGYSAEVCINDYRQPDTRPYDVPVENGNLCLIEAVSNKVSTHQDDASDAVMYESSQLRGADVKYRQCFDSSSLRNGRADGCLASSSKGKLPKKSKKISEIEPTSLSEDEILNLSTPLRVQNTNKANSKSSKKMSSGIGSRRKKAAKVKSYSCQLKDDDLLLSAMVQKKRFRFKGVKAGSKLRPQKKRKSQKSGCRLLPRNLGKGGKPSPDGRWSSVAQRTVLSWLISTGFIFINDIIQCRDLKEEIVVKDGLITRDGIRCKCCNKVFSLSEFKAHTGLEMDCLSLNLVKGSGQPFTLRLLEAWSAEYKARKAGLRAVQSEVSDHNDDSCGICGDGGELLCCDNCPSTFHQSCLSTEELPEGSWYCASCTCWICGNLVDDEASSAYCGFKCCQCEHKYHVACLKEVDMNRVSYNPGFCSGSCEEVYSGLQSRVGLCNLIADGYSWSVLRCIHDNQKVRSAQGFALKAECNSKLAVALTIMEECFVSMVDSRTGIDMIPHVVYNWGSEFPRLNYDAFYNFVLEKNDVVICVASVRVHGAKVAEMPLVATCSKYRRKGMCRRLLTAIEQMLTYLKVENLVVAAIPELVPTWTVGFGFVPVEEEEKKNLHKINLMVFPGTVLLKKTLYGSQTADPQGMDRSIKEEASLGEKCKNYEHSGGSEDTGSMNAELFSSYDMEVVEGSVVHEVSPQDIHMLDVYHNMITGVCVDSRADTFSSPETWQAGAVVSDGTEIELPTFTVSKIGADQEVIHGEEGLENVSAVESENNLGTVKEAEFEAENGETAPQEMLSDEKTETQLVSDTENKLSLMDKLRKLVSWPSQSNANR